MKEPRLEPHFQPQELSAAHEGDLLAVQVVADLQHQCASGRFEVASVGPPRKQRPGLLLGSHTCVLLGQLRRVGRCDQLAP